MSPRALVAGGQRSAARRQHRQQSRQQYAEYWTSKGLHLASVDTVFFAAHLAMSAVHKRVLVTSREQLGFEVAMAIFAGALLMRLFFSGLYARARPWLVFVVHLLLTIIRACVVSTMASKQAVHYRVGRLAAGNESVAALVTTMFGVLGGPFRLFEMMGLQQPWRYHVLNTLLYMALHPWASADGIRLAYSNAMFYQVHQVHDTVSAMFDWLVDAVAGFPTGQQRTCSHCAGVAVYSFMCIFTSVAVPLYTMWCWEQGAMQRWLQTNPGAVAEAQAPAHATQAPAGSMGASSSAASVLQDCDGATPGQSQRSTPGASRHSRHTSSSSTASTSSSGSSATSSATSSGQSSSGPITRLEAICRQAEAVGAEQLADSARLPSLLELVTSSNLLVRWGTHLVVLLVMMMVCWLVANGFALVLLPRVLSSQQLQRWCPNRPFAPYVIAGEVYQGL